MNQTETRKMCNAPEIRNVVPDYIVDMLSDSEAFKVELHLAGCHSCKEHYHTVLRASAEMRGLSSPPVTDDIYPSPKGQFLARQKVKAARKASGSL